MRKLNDWLNRSIVVVSIATLIYIAVAPAATTQPATELITHDSSLITSSAYLAAVRTQIESIEQQLARVEALEAEVCRLEQTIQILTPLLADRSKALRTGDVNGDGKRDDMDLRVWYCCQNVVTSQPAGACWYVDIDANGTVNTADFTLLNAAIKRK